MKTKKSNLYDKLNHLTLEHRIFVVIAIIGIIFSFYTGTLNLILNKGIIPILASYLAGILTIIILIVTLKKQTYDNYAFIGLILLPIIIYPLIWITSGGSTGIMPLAYILNILFIPLVLKRKKAKIVLHVNIVTLVSLLLIESFSPNTITPYSNSTIRIIDISFVLLIIIGSVYLLATILNLEYKNKIESLSITQKQLKAQSITDELSGLFNRRHIKDVLTNNLNNNIKMSIVMVDIDDFKNINDTFGHSVGDRVIITISEVLKTTNPAGNVVGRIGGEEFLIIFENDDINSVIVQAEKLRAKIESLTIKDVTYPVTISLGTYDTVEHDSIDNILVEVDKCLYEAKKLGKNKVVSFSKNQK